LALDAILQLLTLARAGGALLAEATGEASLFVGITLADTALAGAVTGAQVTAAGRGTGVIGLLAGAVGATPALLALALAALADAVILARAQLVLVPFAAEVVALAELAGHLLLRIGTLVALAGAANAITTARAVRQSGVIRPARGIIGILRIYIGGTALAFVAIMTVVALANAAHGGAVLVAAVRQHGIA